MSDSSHPLIMAAPTGARRGPRDHPAIPLTLPDIVATARACHAAGAHALHLHVRDDDGRHCLDSGLYREALAELRKAVPEMLVQITTEAAGRYDVDQQVACLRDLKPVWVSIAVREMARDPALATEAYAICAQNGTAVQHILFDAEDARLLQDWQAAGIVPPNPPDVQLVLGRYTRDQNSSPDDLRPLLDSLGAVNRWMLCAFGPQEHACLRLAASLGGDCRVGFENSFLKADGTPWADNAASVAALVATLNKDR